ncbi:MAG: hypothetical protein FJY98_04010 [Candidatus Liptonbacteria bacterium]|nr:hypothetical protein [Candidatus Liptonbacteria bacterium]
MRINEYSLDPGEVDEVERILTRARELSRACKPHLRKRKCAYGMSGVVGIAILGMLLLGTTGTLPVERHILWNLLMGFTAILAFVAFTCWAQASARIWKIEKEID